MRLSLMRLPASMKKLARRIDRRLSLATEGEVFVWMLLFYAAMLILALIFGDRLP